MYYSINTVAIKNLLLMLCLSILHHYKNFRLLSSSNWHMNTMSNTARKYIFLLKALVSYRIHFQWSIDIGIGNTYCGEYQYQYCQYLIKVLLTTLCVCSRS